MTAEDSVQRGRECEAAGDWDGAERAYTEADNQDDAEAAILLGLVLKRRGDLLGAANAFRRSESRGHPEAANSLGNLLDDTDDVEGARAAYLRAIDAGSRLATVNLGLMLARHGATDEALPYLRVADEGGDPTASWAVGKILEDQGDLSGAVPAYGRGADGGDPHAAFGLGAVLEKLGDRQGARAAMHRAAELGHEGAGDIAERMDSEAEAESRIASLQPGEERLLQTVHRADGNRNDIFLTHRRPTDDATMVTGELVNFVAIIRSTDRDPTDASPPYAWQRGPTEASVCRAVAEAFVNAGVLPGTSVSLGPDVQWLVDQIREERGPEVSPTEATNKWAGVYAAACGEVMTTFTACLDVANKAIGARNMAAQRPQHEISIEHFRTHAERAEQEFRPLYDAFAEACPVARDAAAQLLAAQSDTFAEMMLAMAFEGEALDQMATAKAILGATFGPTPAAFIEGLEQANALIQNPSTEGNIYRVPVATPTGAAPNPGGLGAPVAASAERACPWCAETIKVAAIVCRFCGRDVDMQPNVV